MHTTSVYMMSADKHLLAHWEKLNGDHWKTESLENINSLNTEKNLIIVDMDLVSPTEDDWRTAFDKQRVLVASCYPSDSEGQIVIVAGAKAYLHAYSSILFIEQALTQVQCGQIWVGESLLSRLLSQLGHDLTEKPVWQTHLTAREITIAQRAALGHSNQLIANDLDISVRTVRAHLEAIFKKLEVTDRLMLALKVHGVM